jgi:hypothetical protein
MSTFAITFRELIMDDLRRLCEREAIPVAWEEKEFSDAWLVVMREANRRGAKHLPSHLQDELDWWICRTITSEVGKHMPCVMKAWNERDIEVEASDYLDWCWAGDWLASDLVDGALATLG